MCFLEYTCRCDFCIVNHYLDAYSAIPPALRDDPTKPDSDSATASRIGGRGTESMEVMCMFDARDEEKAHKCKEVTRNAQKQVRGLRGPSGQFVTAAAKRMCP